MIALHEPQFDQHDIDLVVATLKSSWVSTGGPDVDDFEEELAAFTGARHAVAVANGTVGLQLMVETLKRIRCMEGNFEVLVPSLSFIATANGVVHAGGNPVFVDCAAGTLNTSAAIYSRFLDAHYRHVPAQNHWLSKTTGLPLLAIQPAHVMGWATDLQALKAMAAERGIPVLEDAAESLGVTMPDGVHSGTFGLAGCFSFNGNKILTTGGGGMIVTNDDEFAKRAKHLGTTAKSDGLRYVHDEVGYNFRLINILAALGRAQLAKLPRQLAAKQKIFDAYKVRVHGTSVKIHEEPNVQSNHWLVNAVFPTREDREKALLTLNENKVQARPLWTPMHRQPAFAKLPQPTTTFENAERMWNTCLSLPSSPQLLLADIDAVTSLIASAVGGTR